jgi:putative transposase
MQRIQGRHAQTLNARLETSGPLWRGRFHSSVVEDEPHIVLAAADIDANPVDAGMCADPADWPWSSYRANAGLTRPWRWHRPDVLHGFLAADTAEAPAVYRKAVAAAIERASERRQPGRLRRCPAERPRGAPCEV